MSDLDELVKKYKDNEGTLSHREKFDLEDKIWALATPDIRKITLRREWLRDKLGVAVRESEIRHTLHNSGKLVDKLWSRVESKDMTLMSAVALLTKAKRAASSKEEIPAILDRLLEQYDNAPISGMTKDGVTIKKKFVPVMDDPDSKLRLGKTGKAFYHNIRVLVGNYVDESLRDADDLVRSKIKTDVEVEIHSLVDSVRALIGNSKKSGGKISIRREKVSRNRMEACCQLLRVEIPKRGDLPDVEAASRMKRRFARVYHPDVAGDSPILREKYEQVLQAFNDIKTYAEEMAKNV